MSRGDLGFPEFTRCFIPAFTEKLPRINPSTLVRLGLAASLTIARDQFRQQLTSAWKSGDTNLFWYAEWLKKVCVTGIPAQTSRLSETLTKLLSNRQRVDHRHRTSRPRPTILSVPISCTRVWLEPALRFHHKFDIDFGFVGRSSPPLLSSEQSTKT